MFKLNHYQGLERHTLFSSKFAANTILALSGHPSQNRTTVNGLFGQLDYVGVACDSLANGYAVAL
jgi:hypothetical protein